MSQDSTTGKKPARVARTCRDITQLVLQAQDRRLTWVERWAVRAHMLICKACPRFARQVVFMQAAMGRWKQYTEEPLDGTFEAGKHPPV